VGLRPDGEKPATVLWLVYTCGWLPAIIGLSVAGGHGGVAGFGVLGSRANQGIAVLSGAGEAGAFAGSALGVSLAVLSAAYVAAIRNPPSQRVLVAAAAGSVLAALALPLLFSADVYAYAYYGDLALHGRTPYGHGPAPSYDALAAAAVAAWDGHVPPRCVYGPIAVAIAALGDLAGRGGGVPFQIFTQRLAATGAYAAYVACVLRLTRDQRSRAAFVLNPVVIWSAAEGHNDVAMVAWTLAGLALRRGRAALLTLSALVKAPALLTFSRIEGRRALVLALAVVGAGYLPLGIALAQSACGVAVTARTPGRLDRPRARGCAGTRSPRRLRARRAQVAVVGPRRRVRIGGMVCPTERVSVVCVVDRALGRSQYLVALVASTAHRRTRLARTRDYRCRLRGT
jgi:hypothetical protein